MLNHTFEIEGTWEQITSQAAHFMTRRMRLTILPEETAPTQTEDTRSLDEKLDALVASVPAEEWAKLPADMSDNLDHYIYGTPKR